MLLMNYQMSLVSLQMLLMNYQLSLVSLQMLLMNYQLSLVSLQMLLMNYQMSLVTLQLSLPNYQLSLVILQLSLPNYQLSLVTLQLSLPIPPYTPKAQPNPIEPLACYMFSTRSTTHKLNVGGANHETEQKMLYCMSSKAGGSLVILDTCVVIP